MQFLQIIHRLGCIGYILLAMFCSILVLPLSSVIFRTGDEKLIAWLTMIALMVICFVAAFIVVYWRNPGWLIAALVWLPIFFVSLFAFTTSYTFFDGYRFMQNPNFNDREVILLSLLAYQLPVLLFYAARYRKQGTNVFDKNTEKLKENRNVPGLARSLKHRNLQTRINAAEALAEIADQRAVPQLIAAYDENENRKLQGLVLRGLEHAADPRAFDTFIKALTSPSGENRRGAVNGLRKLGDPRSYASILNTLKADPDNLVTSAAAFAIADLSKDDAFPVLLEALRNPNFQDKSGAAAAIATLNHPQVLDALIEALEHPTARPTAVLNLVEKNDPRGLEAVARVIDEHPNERENLLSLIRMKKVPQEPGLQAWVAVSNNQLERAAGYGEVAVRALESKLWAEENQAVLAIELLEKIGSQKAAYALGERMNGGGGQIDIRVRAAQALGKLGGSEAVKALESALEHSEDTVRWGDIPDYPVSLWSVQCAAVEALSEIGTPEALRALEKASRSADLQLADIASQALTRKRPG